MQQLQLQAQLLELLSRRPIALTGHRTGGHTVYEGYYGAQDLLADGGGKLGPDGPGFGKASFEQTHVLAVNPCVDPLQLLVAIPRNQWTEFAQLSQFYR